MNSSSTSKNISDFSSTVLQLKVVYWGPGESGKTTSYNVLKEELRSKKISRSMSVETTDGRTLWKDCMYLSFPLKLNKFTFDVVVQVITCTGQERFLSTREYVLDGADGIVFVADSSPLKREENKRSFRELMSFTASNNVPYVIQLNKRDLSDAISEEEFKKNLELPEEKAYPDGTLVVYPTIATEKVNVLYCFKDLLGLILFKNIS
ncbi:MAG: GTP-binding protein [Promethearchaeota archaeon]